MLANNALCFECMVLPEVALPPRFGIQMQVELLNDGQMTFVLDYPLA